VNWRRFDTLGLRLFVLMWATLVGSHFIAFSVVRPGLGEPPPGARGPGPGGGPPGLPPLGTLPPGNLLGGGDRTPPPTGAPPGAGPASAASPSASAPAHRGLPTSALWMDYALRAAVIALCAALGARWLSGPLKRMAQASGELSHQLMRNQPLPVLPENRGTVEVRELAGVFNGMARRLQEQFDARGMHLASVSHDLRTPLTRLRMRLEDADPALAEAATGDIREMTEMIDATLDVLREQREGSQAQVLELRTLLQAMVDDLADTGHDASLAPGPEARVRVRPAALRRVLANLTGNALRYGGQVRLAMTAADDGVHITVDDSGPGIPAEQLELAFRPWVRLESSHARSGHGLGLAIARDLAERDGGRLTLANRHEGGLRARLVLPAAD
jgi:protein-histidine pros-kinase